MQIGPQILKRNSAQIEILAAAAALGPGGVFLVGLFGVVTRLSPVGIAGTASAIFLPDSVAGAAMSARSSRRSGTASNSG